MLERDFQAKLIRKLKEIFPGCVVLKNDPNYIQGFPDLLILYGRKWAALEVKRSVDAPFESNQEYYILELGAMSYSAVIYPENKNEIIRELQIFMED